MTINHFVVKMNDQMNDTFFEKVANIKKVFANSKNPEEKYLALIELGRELTEFPQDWKTFDRIVHGCQSTLYLHTSENDGKLFFHAHSDALISAGLAALLIKVYSGESPESILTHPPHFINELGIATSLSPNRSNGLAQIHLRMKREALKVLTNHQKV